MSKKKNLLNIFTKDTSYNYHVIKTEEPSGHLIYLTKNGSELNTETLEFSPTKIVEELISECDVQAEKFAPAIFYTEESNTDKLKYHLNDKFSENAEFSAFIETIKDEYRILEVKDSLLFKKDPEAYEAQKSKEYEEHQKDLWDEAIKQHEEKVKRRTETLMSYKNDLIKLMKDYFYDIIEYEKRDFNWDSEFEKFVGNFIDSETWIKINDKPFACRIEICSLEQDKMSVYVTDNNDYSYTATLRFKDTVFVTENIVRINKGDTLPKCMEDYEVLSQLYDINLTGTPEWEYKNHTDRFEDVIDHLSSTFKAEKEQKEKEYVEKILKKEKEEKEKEKEEENKSENI